MNSNTNIAEITKYIDGELSGEALIQFEELLKRDKVLQEEVNFQKEIFKSLKTKSEFEAEKEELVSFLNGLEKKVDLSNLENETEAISNNETTTETNTSSPNPSQKTIFRKILPFTSIAAAAAAVLLFIMAPWKSNLTGSELAEQNFKLFPLESVRSGDDNQNILTTAQKAYDEKDYQSAINSFKVYLKENPDSPIIWLAKGSAEYELDKLDNAIVSFGQVAKLNPDYKPLANWYLALSYLKKEDKIQAKSLLDEISEGEEKYAEAQKLLKEL